MAQVSLQINGFGYILGCADGEEEHLRALAAGLDRRIDEIKASTGPVGEARLLLMVALMLSDELHDFRKQTEQSGGDGKSPGQAEPKAGKRLRGLARRAEAIADSVEAEAPAQKTLLTNEPDVPMPDAESIAATPEHP
jgi:cell division protein ZapA